MNIDLRLELPEDYRESEEVMREAFWNYYAPGCDEHYLLHIMRNTPNFIPELDYVAISEGKIVGVVVFLKSFIRLILLSYDVFNIFFCYVGSRNLTVHYFSF